MENFATVEDVVRVWRPLSEAEFGVVEALIGQASDKLRVAVPTITTQIAADTTGLKENLARAAVVNAVARTIKNIDGYRDIAIDDFRATLDSAVSTGQLYIAEADLLGLRRRNSKWGTINLRAAL